MGTIAAARPAGAARAALLALPPPPKRGHGSADPLSPIDTSCFSFHGCSLPFCSHTLGFSSCRPLPGSGLAGAGKDPHLQGAAPHAGAEADCSRLFTRAGIKGSLTLRCVTSEQGSHGYFYAIKSAGDLPSAFPCSVPSPAHLSLQLGGL